MYLDESGGDGGFPLFAVGGYGFSPDQARRFERKWDRILAGYGLDHFHMVDCAHGNGPYKGLSKTQRVSLQTRLIDLIKASADCAICCIMPLKLHDTNNDKPFLYCLSQAARLADWLMYYRRLDDATVSVFYESAHKHTGMALSVFEKIRFKLKDNEAAEPIDKKHVVSISSIDKKASGCVQAADVLVWQYAKYVKNVLEGRNVRADFKSLMGKRGVFFFVFQEGNTHVMLEGYEHTAGTSAEIESIKELFAENPALDDFLSKRPHVEYANAEK